MGVYKPKGSKFYWFSYTNQGVRIRENTHATDKKLAERVYHKRINELAGKQHFPDERDGDITFDRLMERYLAEVTPDKAEQTQVDDRRYAATFATFFGRKNLSQITSDLVFQYKQKRKLDFAKKWKQMLERKKQKPEVDGSHCGKRTINRELNLLSAAFNQAIKVWRWCGFNPVSCVKREKENKRVKFFADGQFEKVLNCLPDWVKPIVIFAKNTGLRRDNVVKLQWTQVNLEQRMVLLGAEVTKNSENLGVPLNDQAFAILVAQKERTIMVAGKKVMPIRSNFVFCKMNGEAFTPWGVTRAFKRACVKAGYPDFRFHDLRHDFCSQLVQRGIDLYVVKELAGHKDISTTQRYAHLSLDRLRKAVGVLNQSR
jgi:integrase